MRHFGVTPRDLLGPAETPAMRRVFTTVLDRVDRLNLAAQELPDLVRSRRLRAETKFICRLAMRLADRLGKADPLAQRVALTKADGALSLLRAVGALVWR
jgi:phytoene/squalene synthetase